jgi:hypothetical protein
MKKDCLNIEKSIYFYKFIERVVVVVGACYCYQLHTKFYQTSRCQG